MEPVPEGTALEGLTATPSGPLATGVPVSFEVTAVGDTGVLSDFNETVTLAVSSGSIEPNMIELKEGRAAGEFRVEGVWGTGVQLTLSGGGVRSELTLPTVHLAEIPGPPDAVAQDAVPEFEFVPEAREYPTNHPDLSGIPASQSVVILSFAETTTSAQANELLASIGSYIAGSSPGAVCLRLIGTDAPTPNGMDALLATLQSDSRVEFAAQDVLLGGSVIPDPNGGSPADWTWESTPSTGNWGIERMRVPSMWNLNEVAKRAGRTVRTGVLDVGFTGSHPDLIFTTVGDVVEDDHGMHVAGIINGTFDNGMGVDGINPFADLVVHGIGVDTDAQWRASYGQVLTGGLVRLLDSTPAVRLLNVSLGYNWYRAGVDPSTSNAAQQIASQHGGILAGVLAQRGSLPLIVVAAGNEAGATVPSAVWSSPLTNASIEHGVFDILVIENVDDSPGTGTGNVTRANGSCTGGDLSAPGERVRSTLRSGYGLRSGTSMAAPHVTGLLGYLSALDPSLDNGQLTDLLLDTAKTAGGGAASRVDAWAAAVHIDELRQNDAMLTALVDIDDGSPDGNLREEYPSGAPVLQNNFDGDRKVDMSDFRRWRDWVLYAEQDADQLLDGPANSKKLDQNGDDVVGTGPEERMYSRGDFNGDGLISTTAKSFYPGRINAEVTDLEVFQRVFSETGYQASDLPALLNSGDFHIDGSDLLDVPGAVTARVVIRRQSDNVVVAEKNFTTADPTYLVTVPIDPAGFELEAEARDGGFVQLEEHTMTTSLLKCQDVYWKPSSDPTLFVELDVPSVTPVSTAFPISVRAGFQAPDGSRSLQSGISISLQAAGMSFSSSTGTTDANGVLDVEGTLDATTETAAIFVTASRNGFDPVTTQAQVVAVSNLPQVFMREREFRTHASTRVELEGSGDHPPSYDTDQKEQSETAPLQWTNTFVSDAQGNTSYADQKISGTASSSGTVDAEVFMAQGRVYHWEGTASAFGSAVGQNTGSFGFRSTEAVGLAQNTLVLNVGSRTRMTGTVTELSASGVGRASLVINGPQGFRIRHEIDRNGRTDGPPDFDVILEPGQYRFSAVAAVVGSIDRFCGCSQRIGDGAVSWDVSFSQP